MFRTSLVLLVLCALLLAAPSQSAAQFDAPTCPSDICRLYLPLINKARDPLKIGLVTDAGTIDDKGFNQLAWEAVLDAEANLAATGDYLESTGESDYAANINHFISQGYELIITVGYAMADATKTAAQVHPTQQFTIADVAFDPTLPNVIGQVYASEQSAFLSGYLAAGTTKTGKVATFGGMKIPPVTQFMDGYFQGVAYYNQENGNSVQVLGWDPVTRTGEFTNDFTNKAAGLAMGQKLLGQGADIIFPVAGTTGLGAAQGVKEKGSAWVVGVDTDWASIYLDYKDVILTSALKNIRATTYAVIKLAHQNNFVGGNYVGTLANQGVGLGTISSSVPQALLTKLENVKAGIIAGTIPVVIP